MALHVDVQSLFGRTKVAKQDFLQGQERALHVDVQLACYMSSSGLHVDVQNTLTEWVARGLHVDVCCGAPREGARGGEGGLHIDVHS